MEASALEDLKGHAKHLRLVHFTLVVVCATAIAVTPIDSRSITNEALIQLRDIEELMDGFGKRGLLLALLNVNHWRSMHPLPSFEPYSWIELRPDTNSAWEVPRFVIRFKGSDDSPESRRKSQELMTKGLDESPSIESLDFLLRELHIEVVEITHVLRVSKTDAKEKQWSVNWEDVKEKTLPPSLPPHLRVLRQQRKLEPSAFIWDQASGDLLELVHRSPWTRAPLRSWHDKGEQWDSLPISVDSLDVWELENELRQQLNSAWDKKTANDPNREVVRLRKSGGADDAMVLAIVKPFVVLPARDCADPKQFVGAFASWESTTTFSNLFPELAMASSGITSLSLIRIRSYLEQKKDSEGPTAEVFGFSLRGRNVARALPILILIVQLYFWLHFSRFRRVCGLEQPTVAWIGLYPSSAPVLATLATIVIFPVYVEAALLSAGPDTDAEFFYRFSVLVMGSLMGLATAIGILKFHVETLKQWVFWVSIWR